MNNRVITQQDRDNAQRLRAIWEHKKKALELNQTKAAAKLGFRYQSTISQYLNCNIAMNTEVILKFAKLLEVDPAQIDPSVRNLVVRKLRPVSNSLKVRCRLVLSDIGKYGMTTVAQYDEVNNPFSSDIPQGTELVGVEIGSAAWQPSFGLPHNSTAFVLMRAEPDINDIIYAEEPGQAGFYRFNGLQGDELLLTDPLTGSTRPVSKATLETFGLVVGFASNILGRRQAWNQL